MTYRLSIDNGDTETNEFYDTREAATLDWREAKTRCEDGRIFSATVFDPRGKQILHIENTEFGED